jgi:hypothetical protein
MDFLRDHETLLRRRRRATRSLSRRHSLLYRQHDTTMHRCFDSCALQSPRLASCKRKKIDNCNKPATLLLQSNVGIMSAIIAHTTLLPDGGALRRLNLSPTIVERVAVLMHLDDARVRRQWRAIDSDVWSSARAVVLKRQHCVAEWRAATHVGKRRVVDLVGCDDRNSCLQSHQNISLHNNR